MQETELTLRVIWLQARCQLCAGLPARSSRSLADPASKQLIDNRADKPAISVFESASILLYLARTYDKRYLLHFEDDDLEQGMLDWIFWVYVRSCSWLNRSLTGGPCTVKAGSDRCKGRRTTSCGTRVSVSSMR